jgi:hypothetical protein
MSGMRTGLMMSETLGREAIVRVGVKGSAI